MNSKELTRFATYIAFLIAGVGVIIVGAVQGSVELMGAGAAIIAQSLVAAPNVPHSEARAPRVARVTGGKYGKLEDLNLDYNYEPCDVCGEADCGDPAH